MLTAAQIAKAKMLQEIIQEYKATNVMPKLTAYDVEWLADMLCVMIKKYIEDCNHKEVVSAQTDAGWQLVCSDCNEVGV